jgi:hypothetical protein
MGKKAQNRQTPPTISAPQEVKHDREQRRIQVRRHGGDYDRGLGTLNRLCIGWILHGHLPEPCPMIGDKAEWPLRCDALYEG